MNPGTSTKADPRTDSELATAALRFARRVHLGQHRKQTHEPFVEHPIAVARCLAGAGFGGSLIAAAYLHDVVEKTPVEIEEIRERFGPEVADTVDALSDDAAISDYAARKRGLRHDVLAAGRDPVLIYAADRIVNMRDWRTLEPGDREACAKRLGTTLVERLELWDEDLAELSDFDPGLPFLAEIEAELRALHADAEN